MYEAGSDLATIIKKIQQTTDEMRLHLHLRIIGSRKKVNCSLYSLQSYLYVGKTFNTIETEEKAVQ